MFRKPKQSLLICVVTMFISYNSAGASGTLGLDVVSGRPMGEAVTALSEQLGCIITYEDPPFQHKSELEEIHSIAKYPVPKSGEISYDYESGGTNSEIILGLINRHSEEGNAGEFTLLETGEVYNVFPIRYINRKGQLVNHKSILDTKVALSLEDTNLWNAINELCKAVSQSSYDYRLILGNIPFGAFQGTPISREFADESARNVLNEILDVFNKNYTGYAGEDKRFIWQLRFGPRFDENVKLDYNISFRAISNVHPYFMKLIVEHQRPMAAAAKIFEKRFGTVITYEEPPYSCPYDIMGDDNGKKLVGGIIKMDWKLDSSVDDVLDTLIKTSIQPRENMNVFKIAKVDDAYHIYPYMSNNQQCSLVPRISIMNREISFNAQNIDGITFVESICSKLSGLTNEKVVLGSVPEKLSEMLSKHISQSISITNQKARDCLGQFLWNIKADISWQILFDPGLKQYRLILYNISD